MKLWKTFLKRNMTWGFLILVLLAVQEFYLFLVGTGWRDMLYAAAIELFLILLLGGVEFLLYKRHVLQLQKTAEQVVSNQIDLPEAKDAIEECYQELLENVSIDRNVALGKAGRQQSEMQEYYALWVHQIKTPIAAMQLLMQSQREALEQGESESTETLSDMEEELFRIEQYVDMALQYQRIQSPVTDYVIRETKLDKVIRECIRKYAKTMIRKKLAIHYEGTDVGVLTDEKWLGFVVEQILSNAIKYTREGAIEIQVVQEGTWHYIQIKDSGIGIRSEDVPRVFEKGYTGYNGHSNKRSTGLGLYLCKEILEKIGHTIRIESQPGRGTAVWIGMK